jgi:hypothetical protein
MTADRPSFPTAGHLLTRGWPRPGGGTPPVFTAFVRSLQGEETPDADLFHDAWQRLQALLASEMRRRGLWHSPPCYLGVFGADRWDAKEPTGDPMARAGCETGGQVGALGELVADCYAFIFVDRLRSLKRQLVDKPDIDGLVLLNVRHFLHERQREHDPVGYQIFESVHTVVREAIEAGSLRVLAGDARVRNDTVLGFACTAGPASPAADIERLVASWNDTLLADLMGARSLRKETVHVRLRQRLLELPGHGVRAFQFKGLVDPLKQDARRRWAAMLCEGSTTRAGARRRAGTPHTAAAQAERAVESRQSFEFLVRCVSAAIRRIEADVRTRAYLSELWQFLTLHHAADDEPGACRTALAAEIGGEAGACPAARAPEIGGDGSLSYRQLGQRLHIPRERLPLLFTTLRQLAARCWAAGMARR